MLKRLPFQPLPVQKLPKQPKRIETGPLQFEDDWIGVFIRGDSSKYYAAALANIIKDYDRKNLSVQICEGLIDLLLSSEENK